MAKNVTGPRSTGSGSRNIATDNEEDSIGSAHEQNLQGRGHKVGVSTADRIH